MIDFTKASKARERPDSVRVHGTEYKIHTAFPHWVNFERVRIKKAVYADFDRLYRGKLPEDRAAGYVELEKFWINEQPLPHPPKEKSSVIIVDWKIDSEFIRAAFLEKYGIDLLTNDIHWHCFLGLFHALKDTAINSIMEARMNKDKKDKHMEKMLEAWQIAGTKPARKRKR